MLGSNYRPDQVEKVALAALFLFSVVAVVISYTSPATGYELSIYDATPRVFWGYVVSTVLIGVPITFFGASRKIRVLASIAVAWHVFITICLPLIRGYYYYGEGDSMSYLGMVRYLVSNPGGVSEVFYPIIPLAAVIQHHLLKIGTEHAMLLLLPIFFTLFLVFVPIVTRHFTNSTVVLCSSILTASLLLPLNQVSRAGVFMFPYATLFAIFSVPLMIYILSRVLSGRKAFTILAFITFPAMIFIHPQQGLNVILVFSVVAVGYLAIASKQTRAPHQSVGSLVVVILVVFWLWVSDFSRFERSVSGLVVSIIEYSGSTGDVSSAGSSLALYGGSIEEIFVKLFLVSLIFCSIVGVYGVILTLPDQYLPIKLQGISKGVVPLEKYLVFSVVPVVGLFILYVGFSSQYFRHLGFVMAMVTIISPLALRHLNRVNLGSKGGLFLLTVVFIVFLLISAPVIHMSPYVYQSSGHVTEAQADGFSTAFEYIQDDAHIIYLRSSPRRYYDAEVGWLQMPYRATENVFEYKRPPLNTSDKTYYTVTQADREREIELYNGVQVSKDDLAESDQNPRILKIVSNGGFDLYSQNH